MRLFIISCLFACTWGYSQELKNKFGENYYTPDLYQKEYKQADGSPYLNPQFLPAKINDIKQTKLIRFDAFNDQIEIKIKSDAVMILDDAEQYDILMQDGSEKKYHTRTYLDKKGKEKRSYFQLLHEARRYRIYYKERIGFRNAQKPGAYQEALPARFEKEETAFYITAIGDPNNNLIEIPDRLNKFVEVFGSSEDKIKAFIKEKNLKTDRIDDLVMILDYYYNNPG